VEGGIQGPGDPGEKSLVALASCIYHYPNCPLYIVDGQGVHTQLISLRWRLAEVEFAFVNSSLPYPTTRVMALISCITSYSSSIKVILVFTDDHSAQGGPKAN